MIQCQHPRSKSDGYYDDCFEAAAQPGRPTGSPPSAQWDRIPIAIASLDPEISAPWTFEAFVAGRDPGIEAVAAVLGRRAPAITTDRR